MSSRASRPRPRPRRWAVPAAVATAALLVTAGLAGCGSGGSGGSGGSASHQVVLATHDSFVLPPALQHRFERRTGLKLKVVKQGDVGSLVNKLVLTKGDPLADAVFGIDNTFATRASQAGVLTPYAVKGVPQARGGLALPGRAGKELTPVDYGDVCVNVDDAWFARHHRKPPRTLDDLTRPAYRNLFVTPAATTSSPGLAFLFSTIAAKQKAWPQYWSALMRNGAQVTPGWTEAYEGSFTAGGGKGTRPVVLSYSSSPPFTIPRGARRPTTHALLDTCFRQVEYAGVLDGAQNTAGARKLVRFLTSPEVQRSLPESMYVYPAREGVALPSDWARYAPVASRPYSVPQQRITAERTAWLRQWREVVTR